jgi:hypothetical protein
MRLVNLPLQELNKNNNPSDVNNHCVTVDEGLHVIKSKAKAVPQHLWRRGVERRYSSYSLLTSALDGVSGQRHAPAAL